MSADSLPPYRIPAVIDFRYHLVSLIAVFLALAIGIVVGTTALNGYVVDDLRARNGTVIHDKRTLEGQVRDLRTQVSRREQFADAVGPKVVAGQLTDEKVVLVTMPGVSEQLVQDLTRLIQSAGGAVTGRLSLHGDLLDPTKSSVVDDVTAQVAPPGLSLPDDSAARAALELAAATVSKPGPSISRDAAAKVLGGFRGADLVDVQAAGISGLVPATLAVLVSAAYDGTPLDDAARHAQQAAVALATALDARAEGAVLAGPASAAQSGGLIAALRSDGAASGAVSTVDAADTAYGAVATVLALHEQATGRAGRYGQGPGAQAAAPTPAP